MRFKNFINEGRAPIYSKTPEEIVQYLLSKYDKEKSIKTIKQQLSLKPENKTNLEKVLILLNYNKIETKDIGKTSNEFKSLLQKQPIFIGPNGNQLIGYEWKWKWGLKQTNDDTLEVKISDWDNAEECEYCNRKIVKVFYVYNPNNNKVITVGSEHLNTVLGLSSPIKKIQLKKWIDKFEYEKYQQNELEKEWLTYPKDSMSDANMHYNINRKMADKPSIALMKDGKYVRVAYKDQLDFFKKMGWEERITSRTGKLIGE